MTDEQIEQRITWIKANLTTQHEWTKSDFAEFYNRDVTFLLAVTKAYLADHTPVRDATRREMVKLLDAGLRILTDSDARTIIELFSPVEDR